jgi:hypothetical protein
MKKSIYIITVWSIILIACGDIFALDYFLSTPSANEISMPKIGPLKERAELRGGWKRVNPKSDWAKRKRGKNSEWLNLKTGEYHSQIGKQPVLIDYDRYKGYVPFGMIDPDVLKQIKESQ